MVIYSMAYYTGIRLCLMRKNVKNFINNINLKRYELVYVLH